MARCRIGAQIRPHHTTIDQLLDAWRRADELGLDTIWGWDHFFPLSGDPDGLHYECWTVLAAAATKTSRAHIGALVTCNSYRNPDLLADMARTVNELSRGRLILGIGAGWFERDYTEYGYEFGTAATRLGALREALPRIKSRLAKLNPPAEDIPILVGGGGEKVTLRLAAEHAAMWNCGGPPETFAHKTRVLDEWCERIGRDPKEIERSAMIRPGQGDLAEAYLAAGAEHLIILVDPPYDFGEAGRLLDFARTA